MLQAEASWCHVIAGLHLEPTKISRFGVISSIQYKYLHRNQGDSYTMPVPERDY